MAKSKSNKIGNNAVTIKAPNKGVKDSINLNKPGASYIGKDAHKLMGTTGLGVLIGSAYELAKLRRKILNRWEAEKQKALIEGRPLPPRPDTSKGALLAILKGAGEGAVLGGTVGLIPGVGKATNNIAASIHGTVNRALTGSSLIEGNKTRYADPDKRTAFFSETLKYVTEDDLVVFNNIDFSNVNESDIDKCSLYMGIIENFSKRGGMKKQSAPKVKKEPPLIKENKYAQQDADLIGSHNAALPIITGLGGGLYTAYKDYQRDMELWKDLSAANAEKGLPSPTKPVLADYIGSFAKGGLVGATGGVIANATGLGRSVSKMIGKNTDKYFTLDRKNANNAIEELRAANYKPGERPVAETAAKVTRSVVEGTGELAKGAGRGIVKVTKGARNKVRKMQNTRNQSKVENGALFSNLPDEYIKAFNFSYNDYMFALLKKGLKTNLTENDFNTAISNFDSKKILIDLMM